MPDGEHQILESAEVLSFGCDPISEADSTNTIVAAFDTALLR
jgi:hypothetical protein